MIKVMTIQRFDQFDYQGMNIKDYWVVDRTAMMLVSLEMECKGYFERSDSVEIYNKLFFIYYEYLKDLMFSGELLYTTPYDEELAESCRQDGVSLERSICSGSTFFDKTQLFEMMNKNNKAKINVERLESFLRGDEVPNCSYGNTATDISKEETPLNIIDMVDNYQYAIELGVFVNNTSGDEDGLSVKELSKHMAKVFGKKVVTDEHIGELLNALSALNKRKEASEKMRKLANERHYDLNLRKQRIRDFAISELKRNKGEYQCTCVHSQLARYIEKVANRIPPELSLESSDGKNFSLDDIKAFVKDVIDPARIKDDGSVPDKCEIHGLNA